MLNVKFVLVLIDLFWSCFSFFRIFLVSWFLVDFDCFGLNIWDKDFKGFVVSWMLGGGLSGFVFGLIIGGVFMIGLFGVIFYLYGMVIRELEFLILCIFIIGYFWEF